MMMRLDQQNNMTVRLDSLCTHPNGLSLDKILEASHLHSGKPLPNQLAAKKNIRSIQIVSPFYNKSKCTSKMPCFCQYHHKKQTVFDKSVQKERMIGRSFEYSVYKNSAYKSSEANQLRVQTLHTEIDSLKDEVDIGNSNANSDLAHQKEKETKMTLGKVPFKVDCYNFQFEEYLAANPQNYLNSSSLKSNQNKNRNSSEFNSISVDIRNSYISRNSKKYTDGYNIDAEIQKFQKIQTRQRKDSRQMPEEQKILLGRGNSVSLELTKLKEYTTAIIRAIIKNQENQESQENENLSKLLKVKKYFLSLLQKLKKNKPESQAYMEGKYFYQKYQIFLKRMAGHQQSSQSSEGTITKGQGSLGLLDHTSRKYMMGTAYQNISKKSSVFSATGKADSRILSKQKLSKNSNSSKISTGFNQYRESFKKGMGQRGYDRNSGFRFHSTMSSNKQQKMSRFMEPNPTIPSNSENKQSYIEEKESQVNDWHSKTKPKRTLRDINFTKTMKERRMVKIYEILSALGKIEESKESKQILPAEPVDQKQQPAKQEEAQPNNFIDINLLLIFFVESKLAELSLEGLIIQPTDAVLVRKRKMRYLNMFAENNLKRQESSFTEFSHQVLKYVGIYSDYTNLVLKGDAASIEQQIHHEEEIEEPQVQEAKQILEPLQLHHKFLTKKDMLSNLKFYKLVHTEHSEKKKLSINFIPLNLTSIDESNINMRVESRFMEKMHPTCKESDTMRSNFQDTLVQVGLENVCQVNRVQELPKIQHEGMKLGEKSRLQLQKLEKAKRKIKYITSYI